MWQAFSNENGLFMIKIIENNLTYSISFTDFKGVWSSDFSKESLVEKFNDYNPLVEIKIDDALLEVLKLFKEVDKNSVEINFIDSVVHIKIVSDVSDLKFKVNYEFELEPVQIGKFAEMITIPMIQTIYYLEKQQKMLVNLVLNKDKELNEYKMEKGEISRADLVTEPFDQSTLITSSDKMMLNVFGNSDKFLKYISKEHGDVHEQILDVEVEPWNNVLKRKRIWNSKKAKKKINETKITYKT